MRWQIHGAGFFYEFPPTFDLTNYDRANSIPSRPVHGSDGEALDTGNVRRESTIHVMRGIIQKSTVALSLAELDAMEAAINSMPDEVYLVDTGSNRRVAVKLTRSDIPRRPARILPCALFFRTSQNPFWEDFNQTIATVTNQQWLTLNNGDVEVKPEMVIEGFISNPTLVHGKWSFNSHIHDNNAVALKNQSGNGTPYGALSGSYTRVVKYQSGQIGQSLPLSGNQPDGSGQYVQYNALHNGQNPNVLDKVTKPITHILDLNQFTIRMLVNTRWEWNDGKAHTLLQASGNTSSKVILSKGINNRLKFIYGDQSIQYSQASTLRANKWYQVALRGNAHATLEGSTYADLLVDGSVVATITTQPTIPKSGFQYLFVGANSTGKNAADMLVDDLATWRIALASTAVKGTLYNAGNPTKANNVQPFDILSYSSFDSSQNTIVSGGGQAVFRANDWSRSRSLDVTAATGGATLQLTVGSSGTQIFKKGEKLTYFDDIGAHNLVTVFNSANQTITTNLGDSNLGRIGRWAEFGGIKEVSTGSIFLSAGLSSSIAVGLWFARNGIPTTNEILIDRRGDFVSEGYQLYFSPAGSLVFRIDDGTNDARVTANVTSKLDNKWHHIWTRLDRATPSNSNFYFDGEGQPTTLIGTFPVTSLNTSNDPNFSFGSAGNTGFFNGKMRDVRVQIDGTEPSDTQIKYQATHAFDYSGSSWTLTATREYWQMAKTVGGASDATIDANIVAGNSIPLSIAPASVWQYGGTQISRNLQADANMENGNIGGWGDFQTPSSIVKRADIRRTGESSLRIFNDDSTYRGIISNQIDTVSNENYVTRFYYRSAATGQMQISLQDSPNRTILVTSSPTEEFTLFESCWESSTVLSLGYHRIGVRNGTDLEIDDYELYENLVADGGIEDWNSLTDLQTQGNWTETENGTSTVDRGQLTIEKKDSTLSASLSIDSSNSTAAISQTVAVSTGQWYEFGVWANATPLTNSPQLKVLEKIGTPNTMVAHTYTLSTLWHRFGFAVKSPIAGNPSIWIQNGLNCANATVSVDDVSLVRLAKQNFTFFDNPTTNAPRLRPTKYLFGVELSGDVNTYATLIQRSNEMAFNLRFESLSAWSTLANQTPVKTLFDLTVAGSTLGSSHYKLELKDGRYVFGNSVASISAQATKYSQGKALDIGGIVNTAAATVKAWLIESGEVLATTQSFSDASSATLEKIYIGTDRNEDYPPNQIVDELYLYHQDVGIDYIKGEQKAQRQLQADNQLWRFNSTIPTSGYLNADFQKGKYRIYTAAGTVSNVNSNAIGNEVEVGRRGTHKRRDTVFSSQPIIATFRYRKEYY